MRIAIYSDNFYPEISGISDSICTTALILANQGHDILCVSPYYSEKNYKKRPQEIPFFEHPQVTIIRIPSLPLFKSPTGQSRISIPVLTSLSKVRDFAPDIIHTHSPFGTGIEALLVSKKLRVPLVGTNHTPIEKFVSVYLEKISRTYYAWYYNKCNFVSAPYLGLLDDMRACGFNAECAEIPNPVSVDTFTYTIEKENIKKQNNFPEHMILYTGRLSPEKHIEIIIRAVSLLKNEFPNLHLYITGHGSAEHTLVQEVEKYKLSKLVHFEGFVDNNRLVTLYQASDVFVIMSSAETQSLSLMQAYACGTPAVVARRGALPHYTPNECGIVVEPTDIHEVVDAIRIMITNKELRDRLSLGARTFVQKLSASHIAQQWIDVYTRLTSKI